MGWGQMRGPGHEGFWLFSQVIEASELERSPPFCPSWVGENLVSWLPWSTGALRVGLRWNDLSR
jgi:hypothetical protein